MWQASGISVSQFVLGTWLPVAVSGVLTAAALYHFRSNKDSVRGFSTPILARPPLIYLVAVGLTIFILDSLGLRGVLTLCY
jgi:hypothetical protein